MSLTLTRAAFACLLLAGLVVPAAAGSAAAACAEGPEFSPDVTPPETAVPGFPYRRATTQELNDYTRLIDGESSRVRSHRFGTSVGGTPLIYALVGTPDNLAAADQIASRQSLLRDPRVTTPEHARTIAETGPIIVWYTANVHGNETSGADAAISIMYHLASRNDCEVEKMLDRLVVGIMATQNPDGRDAFSRQNQYIFDMNRDWFARTQPETDRKLDVLERYPPTLFIDAHEMGSSDFFFPPNADPIHHEISDEAVGWINDIYGPAMAEQFQARQQTEPGQWDYFNYSIYDLFYMGYGDSVPTTAFTAAGMTFEKGIADPDDQRWEEQFVAGWASLKAAADNKDRIALEYYQAHKTALEEGRRGILEPNQVLQEENTVQRRVPDVRVRHYFVDPRRARPDVARLIDRLLQMDVEVHRLTAPLRVPDLQPYGRDARVGVLPAGTYWIPMAQPQKRWIQALLGEDPYVPFPYFYDITGWSNPLLMNLDAYFSGTVLSPRATPVRAAARGGAPRDARRVWWRGDTARSVAAAWALARDGGDVFRMGSPARAGSSSYPRGSFFADGVDPKKARSIATRYEVKMRAAGSRPPSTVAVAQPKIAVYSASTSPLDESLGHLRFTLERDWQVPFDLVTAAEVAAGTLTTGAYDVFIVPGVATVELEIAATQIRSWIEAGGHYIGTARPGETGGTPYAVSHGFTSSAIVQEGSPLIPGTLFRARLDVTSPLAWGAPDFVYVEQLGESPLTPTATGANAARYPEGGGDFWFSGYAEGEAVLRGTAALVDEKLGEGRVILFAGEPNFRAFTEGTQLLLANAVAYPEAGTGDQAGAEHDVSDPAWAALVDRARRSVPPPSGPGRPIMIKVARPDALEARDVLLDFTADFTRRDAGLEVVFSIPNPRGLDFEGHPFSFRLLPALRAAGVRVRAAIL